MHMQDGQDRRRGRGKEGGHGDPGTGSGLPGAPGLAGRALRYDDRNHGHGIAAGGRDGSGPGRGGPFPDGERAAGPPATEPVPDHAGSPGRAPVRDVYRQVHASADFQTVRRRYRRFVLPATLAFLLWYLAYVIAATSAPGLMARPVAGALNVAMVAGIAQFATTFLLTWAYARHARLHRDRLALELRWLTQEMTRERGR